MERGKKKVRVSTLSMDSRVFFFRDRAASRSFDGYGQDPLEKCAVTPPKGAWIVERAVTWPVLTGRISYRARLPCSLLHDHTSLGLLRSTSSLRPLLPPSLASASLLNDACFANRTSFTLKTVSVSRLPFASFIPTTAKWNWALVRVVNGSDAADPDAALCDSRCLFFDKQIDRTTSTMNLGLDGCLCGIVRHVRKVCDWSWKPWRYSL